MNSVDYNNMLTGTQPASNNHFEGKKNKKGKIWTLEEDDRLRELFKEYGPRWQMIARNMPGRSGKQCSDHGRKVLKLQGQNRSPSIEKHDQLQHSLGQHQVENMSLYLASQEISGKIAEQFRNPDIGLHTNKRNGEPLAERPFKKAKVNSFDESLSSEASESAEKTIPVNLNPSSQQMDLTLHKVHDHLPTFLAKLRQFSLKEMQVACNLSSFSDIWMMNYLQH